MLSGLSARDAALRIIAAVAPQPALRVPLDSTLGSVLAEPVVSPIDVPYRTNAAMDGYAARAADVRGATRESPRRLVVVEHLPAGRFPSRAVEPGQAIRIFTGAPLPDGADSVIRQEDTDVGAEVVSVFADRDCGVNIRLRGEDIRAGVTVLEPGVELGPAHLGVLASLAVAHPVVHRRPRVAILAGGDEIVDIDQPDLILSGEKVASSNSHTLAAMIKLAGGVPVQLGIAGDTPESVARHLEPAADCDLLVTSAGVSVGEHDHLRAVIEAGGGGLDFWRVRIRPGGPVAFGRFGAIPWIGLPGNPVSTMVTFELFVRPAIRRMMGQDRPFRRAVPVEVGEPVRLSPRLQHFLRAVVAFEPDGPVARLTGPQGSGILTSMMAANALLIVPEGRHETAAGDRLTALVLDDPRCEEQPPF